MFSQEELLEALGSSETNEPVKRFQRFANIPRSVINKIAQEALPEEWGNNNHVLLKYLSIVVPWSIENGLFTQNPSQFYVSAGHLQTRYGTPIFLVFNRIVDPGRQPYCLIAGGSKISAPIFPIPPQIPLSPEIPKGADITMLNDHIIGDNSGRIDFLKSSPPITQICAVAGAIQWSINRNLQIPYWYYGRMNFLIPLYLQSRDDITLMPDCVAPIQVTQNSILVRTILEPHMPYTNARVAVQRHDSLPSWLLNSWKKYSENALEPEDSDEPTEIYLDEAEPKIP